MHDEVISDFSQDINNTNNSDINSNNTNIDANKPKNYHRLIRKCGLWVGNNFYKKKLIECYSTGGTGTYIKDAITGISYPYKVGSKYERLFFRVSICTGENKTREPINLYYLTPTYYEKHFLTKCRNDSIEQWMKNKELLQNIE